MRLCNNCIGLEYPAEPRLKILGVFCNERSLASSFLLHSSSPDCISGDVGLEDRAAKFKRQYAYSSKSS